MPRPRQSNYGGNRVGRTASRAFPREPSRTPSTAKLVLVGGPVDAPTKDCPVCGLSVRLRASDGQMRSHRVGSTKQGIWPCPGARSASDNGTFRGMDTVLQDFPHLAGSAKPDRNRQRKVMP